MSNAMFKAFDVVTLFFKTLIDPDYIDKLEASQSRGPAGSASGSGSGSGQTNSRIHGVGAGSYSNGNFRNTAGGNQRMGGFGSTFRAAGNPVPSCSGGSCG